MSSRIQAIGLDLDPNAPLLRFWQEGINWVLLGIVVFSGVLAWLLARHLRSYSRSYSRRSSDHLWQLSRGEGAHALAHIIGPALFTLVIWVWIALLRKQMPVSALELAASLGCVLALVRFFIHLLRSSFPDAHWLPRARIVAWGVISFLWVIYALGAWREVIEGLDTIDFPLGKYQISLLTLFHAVLFAALTWLTIAWFGKLLERRVMRISRLDLSLRVVLAKLLRASLILLGVMVALPLIGVDLTLVSVIGGALGVGVGLSLRNIAANYFSGFVILLDGSLRIGDLITFDHQRYGKVTHINTRLVRLRYADGEVALVPNETILTSTVYNLSQNDRINLARFPLILAHGADVAQAEKILYEILSATQRALSDPPPKIQIRALSTVGIELDLIIWLEDFYLGYGDVKDHVYREVLARFPAAGLLLPVDANLTPGYPDKTCRPEK